MSNIDIELYNTQTDFSTKSENIDLEITDVTSQPDGIVIEITGLKSVNKFIGLEDTPVFYENGKFIKVEDNKIVYADITWADITGDISDNPEIRDEIARVVEKTAKTFVVEVVNNSLLIHDANELAHPAIRKTIDDNFNTLNTNIELAKVDLQSSINNVDKKVDKNASDITDLQAKTDKTNEDLEALTLKVNVDITNDIADLATTVTNNYNALDTRINTNANDIADLYNKKVDKVEGKELSTNDFTNELKSKLENIEATAQVNIIESISVDGVNQTIDANKNVDLHQPVYTLVENKTPDTANIKEYNLTIDGNTTGVTVEIPKDVYIKQGVLKFVTTTDTPYVGAKVKDAYLEFDRENSTPIYVPIPELQIHAGQDITISDNNTIATVIPIPRNISELNNDNYTVTDENYVHTDNNFSTDYINRIEDVEKTAVKDVSYNKETQKITVTFGDKTTKELTLEDLLTGASYNGETGDFTFTKANGEPVVVNTPKENFLSDVQYDGTTKIITFTMANGSTFEVNISDLIDIYTVKSTNSVEMSIVDGNQISSNVKISDTNNNIISVKDDGIFAEHQDVSHLATKADLDTKQDTIPDLDTIRSGAKLGSTAIQNTNDCVHKAGAETISGVKTFSGGKSGVYNSPSVQINNAVFCGNANISNFTGFYNHRKCLGDSSFVNTAGFIVNSDGSAKFMHRRGTTTGYGTADDSYIAFNKNKLIFSTDGNTTNEKDILHSGNTKTINGESILGSGNIVIKSAPDLDNKTITKNTAEELQAIGVINSADGTTALKTWTGTKAEYSKIETKDSQTVYNITDDEEELLEYVPIATTTNVGLVKPDGTTITIKNGVISSVGGGGGGSYTLPVATSSVLGGVKVGNNLSVTADGVLSVGSKVLTTNTAYTKTEIDTKIGNIETILDNIIAGS